MGMALPLRGEDGQSGNSTGMSCKAELEDRNGIVSTPLKNIAPRVPGVKRESYFWRSGIFFPAFAI
jgi:hypothetical protein